MTSDTSHDVLAGRWIFSIDTAETRTELATNTNQTRTNFLEAERRFLSGDYTFGSVIWMSKHVLTRIIHGIARIRRNSFIHNEKRESVK